MRNGDSLTCLWIIQKERKREKKHCFICTALCPISRNFKSKLQTLQRQMTQKSLKNHSKQFEFAKSLQTNTADANEYTLPSPGFSICQAQPPIGEGVNWSGGQTHVEKCLHINHPRLPPGGLFLLQSSLFLSVYPAVPVVWMELHFKPVNLAGSAGQDKK